MEEKTESSIMSEVYFWSEVFRFQGGFFKLIIRTDLPQTESIIFFFGC